MQKKETVIRFALYLIGMIILASGLVLNTKAGLGVSPIISVAYVVSQAFELNFGNVTLIWYCTFIVVEMILHLIRGRGKQVLITDMLQFPVALLVTRFINLFGSILPDFAVDYTGQFMGSVPGRLIVLVIAIILTGIGAALSLSMRVIPNPGDGIVQGIADFIHQKLSNVKNCFDISCVVLATILSFLLTGKLVGIGIGTVCAMIGVGRVIAVWNLLTKEKLDRVTGIVQPA